jgi:hypothetical protein
VTRNKIVCSVAFAAGLLLAVAGGGMLALATSGAFVDGRAGAYVTSASLLAVAIPLLALPFSARIAKLVAFLVLVVFALAMLWAAFGSADTTSSLGFQVAAIVFSVLLLLRGGMALRKTSGVAT